MSSPKKYALITGGSRGIGAEIALGLACKGVHVVINYINNQDAAAGVVKQIKDLGVEAHAIRAHIGDKKSRAELMVEYDKLFPKLDYFIANAAIGVFKPMTELSLNSIKKVFAVNVESFLELTQQAVKRMGSSENDSVIAGSVGRIVALSSLGAEKALPNYGSVGASKAAMESMARQFAVELGPQGINVNVVRAGLVDTGILRYVSDRDQILKETCEKTPNRRITTTKEVADLVCFLTGKESSMINGQTLMVDGGQSATV